MKHDQPILLGALKTITRLLNEHYREGIVDEFDIIEGGQFILKDDPTTNRYEIGFIWYNDFGLSRDSSKEREEKILQNKVLPATKTVRERISELEEFLTDGRNKIPLYAFHQFDKDHYIEVVEDGI